MKIEKKGEDKTEEENEAKKEENAKKAKEEEPKKTEEETKKKRSRLDLNEVRENSWKIIHSYFQDKSFSWVQANLDSYNYFYSVQIRETIRNLNPICFKNEEGLETRFYLGGKDTDKIYFGKPVVYDNNVATYMFPRLAKLRNMSYSSLVHVDVVIETDLVLKKDDNLQKDQVDTIVLDKVPLFELPIMVNSKLCVLHNLDPKVREYMGEKVGEVGGDFIVEGKNMFLPLTKQWLQNEVVTLSANKSSVLIEPYGEICVLKKEPDDTFINGQYVVTVPGFKCPVPLFVLMRALGFQSDKEIVTCCLQGTKLFEDDLISSVHDSGRIFSKESALSFLSMMVEKGSEIKIFWPFGNFLAFFEC